MSRCKWERVLGVKGVGLQGGNKRPQGGENRLRDSASVLSVETGRLSGRWFLIGVGGTWSVGA